MAFHEFSGGFQGAVMVHSWDLHDTSMGLSWGSHGAFMEVYGLPWCFHGHRRTFVGFRGVFMLLS